MKEFEVMKRWVYSVLVLAIAVALVGIVSAGSAAPASPIDQVLTVVKDIQAKLDIFIRSTGSSLKDIHDDLQAATTKIDDLDSNVHALGENAISRLAYIQEDLDTMKNEKCVWRDAWKATESVGSSVNIDLRNFGPSDETVKFSVTYGTDDPATPGEVVVPSGRMVTLPRNIWLYKNTMTIIRIEASKNIDVSEWPGNIYAERSGSYVVC